MNNGIYVIKNTNNGRVYVGSTGKLLKRWNQHKYNLKNGTHFNSYLQNAWNKHGEKSFVYEIVEMCDKNLLLDREEFWIKSLHSYKDDNGYNLCKTPRASRLGCKATPETIAKMSKSLSGKNHPNWGKTIPKKSVVKMIKSQTGVSKPKSGKKKSFTLKSPNGNVITIYGLRRFCRENGICHSMLWRVAKGKQIEYNGWQSVL